MSLEAAQNGSSRQTSAISRRRSSFASASLARLPPHTSKSSPGDVREAGGQRSRTSPRCREAARACLFTFQLDGGSIHNSAEAKAKR